MSNKPLQTEDPPDASADARGDDALYVGYLPQAPAATARFVRAWLVALFLGLPLLVGAIAWAQGRGPGYGTFAYGETREFEGLLVTEPVPVLLPLASESPAPSAPLLVGFLKNGIPEVARQANGQVVTFTGTLIYRQNLTMVEITDVDSFSARDPRYDEDLTLPREPLANDVTLTGELVDTKCYLGVMRPGEGKCHRACAVICLQGGVPPGLLIRDASGYGGVFMLANADGTPLTIDPQLAARQLSMTGDLELVDGTPVLRVSSWDFPGRPAPESDAGPTD